MSVAILKEAKAEEVDIIVEVARSVTKLPEDAVIPEAKKLVDSAEFDDFRLGAMLNRINCDKLWSKKGAASFGEFAERELGLRRSKAYYLADVYTKLVNAEVPWAKVKHLGWTKLRHLARLLSEDNVNVDEWIDKAAVMNVQQLQDAVREHLGAEPKTKRTLSFSLYEDQWETVGLAINKAKQELDTRHNNVAIDAICQDYLAGNKLVKPLTLLEMMMRKRTQQEVLTIIKAIWPDFEAQAGVYGEEPCG